MGQINKIPSLVQILAWCRSGKKPLSEQWWLIYRRIYASLSLNELMSLVILPQYLLVTQYRVVMLGMMTSSNGTIFRVTGALCGEFTGPRGGALVFSLISAWLNGSVNNREGGDLGRYRTHYDVTVTVVLVRRALYISLLPNSLDTSVLMEVTHYKTIIVPILFIRHKMIFSAVVNTVVKYLRQHVCFCITYSRGLI